MQWIGDLIASLRYIFYFPSFDSYLYSYFFC